MSYWFRSENDNADSFWIKVFTKLFVEDPEEEGAFAGILDAATGVLFMMKRGDTFTIFVEARNIDNELLFVEKLPIDKLAAHVDLQFKKSLGDLELMEEQGLLNSIEVEGVPYYQATYNLSNSVLETPDGDFYRYSSFIEALEEVGFPVP